MGQVDVEECDRKILRGQADVGVTWRNGTEDAEGWGKWMWRNGTG